MWRPIEWIKYTWRLWKRKLDSRTDSQIINDMYGIGDTFMHTIFFGTDKYVDYGEYVMETNLWGKWKLKEGDDLECYVNNRNIAYVAPTFNRGVLGYPRVKTKNFINKVSDLKHKTLIIDCDYYFCPVPIKYNLAYDMWITEGSVFDFPKVKHEIMIWEEHLYAKPSGKRIAKNVLLNGSQYDVYSGMIDKSKENLGTDGWMLTTFVKKKNIKNMYLNVSVFLAYMHHSGILDMNDTTQYLQDIEFGSEIFNASALLSIQDFNYYLD